MDLQNECSIDPANRNIIPLVAVTSPEEKYNKYYHRWQLPLEPAFACTTHKMQEVTASNGAVIQPSINKPFARGLDYVPLLHLRYNSSSCYDFLRLSLHPSLSILHLHFNSCCRACCCLSVDFSIQNALHHLLVALEGLRRFRFII